MKSKEMVQSLPKVIGAPTATFYICYRVQKEIRGGGVWASLELIELEHFCQKLGPGHKNAIRFDQL